MSAEVKKCPFCGVKMLDIYLSKGLVQHPIAGSLCILKRLTFWKDDWNHRTTVSIETAQKLADSIMAYIDEFGLDHEDGDCPDDDTCKCERRQAINKALAAFNREKVG